MPRRTLCPAGHYAQPLTAPSWSLPLGYDSGAMEGQPAIEHTLGISDEKHTGLQMFIPYCGTGGCQWIGHPHLSKAAAQQEGATHVNPRQELADYQHPLDPGQPPVETPPFRTPGGRPVPRS